MGSVEADISKWPLSHGGCFKLTLYAEGFCEFRSERHLRF